MGAAEARSGWRIAFIWTWAASRPRAKPPLNHSTRALSASVKWVVTLPIEMKKAIQDRIAVVGMDREEVVASIGKPEHKVRERDAEGNDIEDWIYGQPPSKTVFVRFTGTRVTSVKQYPQ